MAEMTMSNDIKGPPTQFGAPAEQQTFGNIPSPAGFPNKTMVTNVVPPMGSRPFPPNNNIPTSGSNPQLSSLSSQNGAPNNPPALVPQSYNGSSQFPTHQPTMQNPQITPIPQHSRPSTAYPNLAPPPLPGQIQNQNIVPSNGQSNQLDQSLQNRIPPSQSIQKYPTQPQMQQYIQVKQTYHFICRQSTQSVLKNSL